MEDYKQYSYIKDREPSFPSLPKYIGNTVSNTKLTEGYKASVWRGFHKRVSNWINSHPAKAASYGLT